MKRCLWLCLLAVILAACGKPHPLTRELAAELVQQKLFRSEPVYAEVPQKVWFGPKSPQDAYDLKSIETLHNLERVGLITVTESHSADGMTTFQGKFTKKGFYILGTMPSARGVVFRGRICEKVFDSIENFIRHPQRPDVGRTEVVWHYDHPTPLYALFTTRINKPLKKPFMSIVSIYWRKGSWRFDVIVPKTERVAGDG